MIPTVISSSSTIRARLHPDVPSRFHSNPFLGGWPRVNECNRLVATVTFRKSRATIKISDSATQNVLFAAFRDGGRAIENTNTLKARQPWWLVLRWATGGIVCDWCSASQWVSGRNFLCSEPVLRWMGSDRGRMRRYCPSRSLCGKLKKRF
jgi:hypothetical protein